MRTDIRSISQSIILMIIVIASSFICVPVFSIAEEEMVTKQVRQIAVMPFLVAKKPEKVETIMTCRLDGICLKEQAVIEGAEKSLTNIFQKQLIERYGVRVVPQEKVMDAYSKAAKYISNAITPLDMALTLGKELNVGYVVFGNVWRFRQQDNNAVEGERPTAVAFTINLVDVDRGASLWKKTFEKHQQALSENILRAGDFFKQRGKWLTAEELAQVGAKEILKEIPIQK
ncbi:MAG: hypothetical protein SWH68_07050 [Thermodesulfobacteriota bacterium]|nr:hypothetical protein [Thermodesulfobacteriota bacterium]